MSNWQKVKIGDFLFERKGRYKPNYEQIVNLPRIEKIDFSGNFHIGNKDSKTDMILIKDGDLVISGINVAKGAIGIYSGEDVTATIHYSSYTFDSNKINVEYFKRFLKSSEFIELLNEQVKGGIKTEIKPKHILPLEIQLPDINTQAQIVQHFENVEDDIADVTKEVLKQESLLKKLKQTILQEAIEGKLTAKWRAKNPDIGTAKELLDQIKTEKEQLVKDKKIKASKLLAPINEDEIPFDIPPSWEWCKFGEIIYENPRNGYSPKTVDYKTEIKTLKLGAITQGYFDSTQIKYLDISIEKDSFLWLKKGDILIQRSNSLEHVGMAGIYNLKDTNYIYPDLIMKCQVVQPVINYFIHKYLVSNFTREYFRNNASGAQQSMPKINQGTVTNLLVPLPPTEEQKEIVATIEKLFTICDELESEINQNKTTVDNLMARVLKEAFEQQ